MNKIPIKLAIIDDHDLLRKGICQFVEHHGFKAAFDADGGNEALKKVEETKEFPDIFIIDLRMQRMNGIELATILREKYPTVKILVYTMEDHRTTVEKLLRLEVNGYVLKAADPNELKEAVEVIYNGGRYFSAGVAEIAEQYYSTS